MLENKSLFSFPMTSPDLGKPPGNINREFIQSYKNLNEMQLLALFPEVNCSLPDSMLKLLSVFPFHRLPGENSAL